MAFLAEYIPTTSSRSSKIFGAWMRCFDPKLAAKAPVFKKKATTDAIRWFVNFDKLPPKGSA